MLRCGKVLEEGMQAHRDGVAFHHSPYSQPSEPVFAMGYHGIHPIGPVRVGIDFRNWWEMGWNLSARTETEVGTAAKQ